MGLGHQLVKEQLFFRKELRERVYWFVQLRWVAIIAALLGCWTLFYFNRKVPVFQLTLVVLAALVYNFVFFFVWLRLKSFTHYRVRPFEIFAHTQIICDLIALFLIIYFTGGIYSPVLIAATLHIILAGILLPPASCFAYAVLVISVLGGMILVQKTGLLPLYPILIQNPLFAFTLEFPGILFLFLTLAAFILVLAFLITSIKVSLRIKVRELLKVSKELDASNTKLIALYNMVKELSSLYDLQPLLDAATRNAAIIMDVKGCSIKLLDSQRKILKFSSMYGLSKDYVAKESIEIEKSPVNLKIIQGEPFSVGQIDSKDSFQYPEDIQKEGIAAMVCLPLRVEKMVLGVFCIYSDKPHSFETEDVAFFTLMADLTALGIESIKRELNKTWFLAKAAHQLRSPLNAISSMLEVLQREFQGPLNSEQKESILRCKTRIKFLGETINDLLKIGVRRTETKKTEFPLVDVKTLVQELAKLYGPRALEKNLDLKFEIDPGVPLMGADKQLLDDLFSNLISNAIKYTPSQGEVRVVLSREKESQLRFQVSDTGIGIPEQDFSKIFSEFFRAENARNFTENGTGLGLILVKEALDILKGSVSVESTLGQGTRITCFLPLVQS